MPNLHFDKGLDSGLNSLKPNRQVQAVAATAPVMNVNSNARENALVAQGIQMEDRAFNSDIRAALTIGPRVTLKVVPPDPERTPIAVVMASYTPKSSEGRVATIIYSIRSVAAQTHKNVRLYVGDNGLSQDDKALIMRTADNYNLRVKIVPAYEKPGCPVGRNGAIKEVVKDTVNGKAGSAYMYVMDDDSLASPNSLEVLQKGIRTHGLSHISGTTIAAPKIDDAVTEEWLSAQRKPGRVEVFPRYWDAQTRKLELGIMLAHSSDGIGKENGAMVPLPVAEKLVREGRHDGYYLVPTFRTSEDMLLATVMEVNNMGRRGRHTAASVLDQERITDKGTFWQNMSWALDHQAMAMALADRGMLDRGVTAYVPKFGSYWEKVRVLNGVSENMAVSVVNPEEVRALVRDLKKGLKRDQLREMMRGYDPLVEEGVPILEKVLAMYDTSSPLSRRVMADMPIPLQGSKEESTRFTANAKVARVAGAAAALALLRSNHSVLAGVVTTRIKGKLRE